MTTPPRDLLVALEAADQASRLIMADYARREPDPDAPASVTTATDHASQDLILNHLRAAFPDDAFCAEEATPTLAASRRSGDRLWIIDPIDGTRGFARKNGEFSVMIALVVSRGPAVIPAVGVVAEPAADRVTFSWHGGGCWVREAGGERRCRVSETAELSAATLVRSHSRSPWAIRLEERLRPAHVQETYSAGVKLARVARGEADLYVFDYEVARDWDLCAGDFLVREAGGQVTDLDGCTLSYGNDGATQSRGLVASNGKIHEAALRSLNA